MYVRNMRSPMNHVQLQVEQARWKHSRFLLCQRVFFISNGQVRFLPYTLVKLRRVITIFSEGSLPVTCTPLRSPASTSRMTGGMKSLLVFWTNHGTLLCPSRLIYDGRPMTAPATRFGSKRPLMERACLAWRKEQPNWCWGCMH